MVVRIGLKTLAKSGMLETPLKENKMEKLELQRILEISNKIDSLKSKVNSLAKIIGSCGITAQISGTPSGRFGTIEYRFTDSDLLKEILTKEKAKIEKQLQELEVEFSKISVTFQ